MNIRLRWSISCVGLLSLCGSLGDFAAGADWPTWRYDAARTAVSPQQLPAKLHLQWTREESPLTPAYGQPRQQRLQFDLGYEPVVSGQTLLFGSSQNDRLTAVDTRTGAERWRFYAEGPLRLAPAVWEGKVYLAADDGRLYCLQLSDGQLLWSVRAAPHSRRVLGNGRLISLWPVRGGPVVHDGRVYFAAGVWPMEGTFIRACDAASGRPLWCNDRVGALYLTHPHGAASFGGPSPHGYLLVHQGHLAVPSGRAFPAFFALDSGKLEHFDFGYQGHGSKPGSWFLATGPDGRLCVDVDLNAEIHDVGVQVIGQAGVKRLPAERLAAEVTVAEMTYKLEAGVARRIVAGGRVLNFDQPPPQVQGQVHTMLAADGRLFVVTREGRLYCFAADAGGTKTYTSTPQPLATPADGWSDRVKRMLADAPAAEGVALVCGLGSGRLIETLLAQTKLQVIVVDADQTRVDAFRRRMDQAGLYGPRVAACVAQPGEFAVSPYFADLVTGESVPPATCIAAVRWLRPYGGRAWFPCSSTDHERVAQGLQRSGEKGLRLVRQADASCVIRAGALPGAADYTGAENFDQLVRAPLTVLWFGDTFYHHKLFYPGISPENGRGLPQTIVVRNGIMYYRVPRIPHEPNPVGLAYGSYLKKFEEVLSFKDVYTDVYTGRALSADEAHRRGFPAEPPATAAKPAPRAWSPVRRNPLTGAAEAREFLKTYGCDQWPVDYGDVFTMRSATAAFYDCRLESGTINISGIRSGCRNNLVPADGVLNVPSWTGNCTCNYPLATSLALVHADESHEQWSAWGGAAVAAPIRRLGLNFGAPGDRMAADGTLWLDYPSVGGPSPEVPVRVLPDTAETFYRHALWMQGGAGQPWVTASGVTGVQSIEIEPRVLKPTPTAAFGVRWRGTLRAAKSGTYTFHLVTDRTARLWLGDIPILDSGKNLRRGAQQELTGTLELQAGRAYPVRLEYGHHQGAPHDARLELRWSSSATPKAPIPAECLAHPDGQAGGLTGFYYDNAMLTGPAVLQRDAQLLFQWGAKLPACLQQAAAAVKLTPRRFTVRLFFAEPDDLQPGQRVFSVRMQGAEVLKNFDIVAAAGGNHRGVLREFSDVTIADVLRLEFISATAKPPLICGVELVARD